VCTGFSIIDRIADALGFAVPPSFAPGARVIRRLGYWWMSGVLTGDGHSIDRGAGEERKVALFERVKDAVLRGPGAFDPDIRRRIAEGRDVPGALEAYVSKVFQHAYKVTDEDVVELARAGYSEDQIFEATVAAALGAGLIRLESGLAALGETRARTAVPA
jgi:alkylhydroperoxidase family enzyme